MFWLRNFDFNNAMAKLYEIIKRIIGARFKIFDFFLIKKMSFDDIYGSFTQNFLHINKQTYDSKVKRGKRGPPSWIDDGRKDAGNEVGVYVCI